jgi:hypothetical protein
MKKLVLFLSLGLLFAFYSCDSNDDPIDEVLGENVISNDADAVNLVKGILKTQGLSSGGSFLLESLTESAVSFEGEDDEDGPLVSRFALTPTNWYVDFQWGKQTGAVSQANEAIEKISAIPDDTQASETKPLSTAGKNQALGGAYFVRGLAYFYLVQLWGEVPIYTSTQNATGGTRASIADVYTQIEKDLKEAERLLPETSSAKSYPNKYAADAILAKVYLTWATVPASASTANNPVTADVAKLNNAVTYADKVINSGQYELEADFIKTQPGRNNKFGKEHIYNIAYVLGEDGPNDGGNHQAHCAFSYGFDADPNTQPTHIGPSSFDLYEKWDNNNAHKELDQRREFSYTAHLAKPKSGATPALDSVYNFTPETGWLPVFGKGIDRSYYEGPLVGPTERDLDRIEIRYADVLLAKAEALIEANKNLSDAKNIINQIRRRAYQVGEYSVGNNNLNPTDIEIASTNQADLRTALRQERFNEFIYEQKRWLDLARWHILTETVKKVNTFPEYSGTYTQGTFFAKVKKHLGEKYAAINADPVKYYRFPIPETARETNPNLTQNPGY